MVASPREMETEAAAGVAEAAVWAPTEAEAKTEGATRVAWAARVARVVAAWAAAGVSRARKEGVSLCTPSALAGATARSSRPGDDVASL